MLDWEVQGGAGISSEGPVTIPTSLSLREVSGLRLLHVVTAALMMVMAVSSVNGALQQDTGGLRLAMVYIPDQVCSREAKAYALNILLIF